jgi:hypothetical protein
MGSKKQIWEPMRVKLVGDVASVLRGGGGKLSTPGGDPGESRKQGPGIDP